MKRQLVTLALASLLFIGCKTSEANYRAAYDKAVAAREADDDERETIYGGASRRLDQKVVISGSDSIPVSVKRVSIVTEKGAQQPVVHKYMVVAGQFKQKFNALSLCKRLSEDAYPDAVVVQTAEPYYYVVAASFDKIADADTAMSTLKKQAPVVMKDPLPFILRDPRN